LGDRNFGGDEQATAPRTVAGSPASVKNTNSPEDVPPSGESCAPERNGVPVQVSDYGSAIKRTERLNDPASSRAT